MNMKPVQMETVDNLKPRHINGSITTGSAYIVVTSSQVIRSFMIQNPKRGPQKNNANTYIEYSADQNNTWYTLARGDRISVDARPLGDEIRLRTNVNGANYQMVVLEEDHGA